MYYAKPIYLLKTIIERVGMLSISIKNTGLFLVLALMLQTSWAEPNTPVVNPAEEGKISQTVTPSSSPSPARDGRISRAVFTSSVQNHEPIDQLNTLSQLISEVFYFTEFRNFQGQTLVHEWSHNGKLSHRVSFAITGKRWRVHSSKAFKLGKAQEGTWTVKILDATGTILRESRVNYIRPSTHAEIEQALKVAQEKKLKNQNEANNKAAQAEKLKNPAEANKTVQIEKLKHPNDVKKSMPNNVTVESSATPNHADQRPIWDRL